MFKKLIPATTTVTLTYTNKAGAVSTPCTTTIPANGNKEVTANEIANSTDIEGGYITISSTNGLAAFVVYCQFIWEQL